jgi:hypothetical protein
VFEGFFFNLIFSCVCEKMKKISLEKEEEKEDQRTRKEK